MKKVEKVIYSLVFSSVGLTTALVALDMEYFKGDVWLLVGVGLSVFIVGFVECKRSCGKGKLELLEDPNPQDIEKLNQEGKK